MSQIRQAAGDGTVDLPPRSSLEFTIKCSSVGIISRNKAIFQLLAHDKMVAGVRSISISAEEENNKRPFRNKREVLR